MKPIEDFIPREIENKDLKKLLCDFSEGLDSVVDFGSNVFKWDLDKNKGGDENIPITLSLRHFIDLIDGISILVKKASIDPAILLLRGGLEVYFGLDYLFKADTHNRSMAFMVWNFHKKLIFYDKFDPSSQQGQQFQASLNKDEFKPDFSPGSNSNLQDEKMKFETLLQQPSYADAEREYQKLIQSGEKNPTWFRLFNGPRNIEQLAFQLNKSVFYEFLYRQWSGPTHGTDIFEGKIFGNTQGSADIVQIRYPKDAQSVTSWAITLSIMVYKLYLEKRIPEKMVEFNNWYLTIKDLYQRLSGRDPLIKIS